MALFGAPTAHEDDPERAVRAALAIRDFARRGRRSSCASGSRPARRSFGSTRSPRPEKAWHRRRRQHGGTAAERRAGERDPRRRDDVPRDAHSRRLRGGERGRGEGQGRADPGLAGGRGALALRRRRRTRGALGARRPRARARVVSDAFERARHERTPQLLTLVGVPGIGKSRLVYELQRIVDSDPELITWRQGRCLAYGDGITLWALGEIVKAQAGVLEQDTPEEIAGEDPPDRRGHARRHRRRGARRDTSPRARGPRRRSAARR